LRNGWRGIEPAATALLQGALECIHDWLGFHRRNWPCLENVRLSYRNALEELQLVTSEALMSSPADPLEGEDIETEHWEDARHWMSIYDDLVRFKLSLLDRVQRDLAELQPIAQTAAAEDIQIIEAQMEGYYARLDLWYRRVWQLRGLWLDPDGRILRHGGREVVLTNREFELLQFLLDHPHRYYTAAQIMGQAWSDSALFPGEVRNYVARIRRILKRLEIPCDLVNRPGRGYSLTFRNAD
jgi:Transcriptional regulatory protein, C terminal